MCLRSKSWFNWRRISLFKVTVLDRLANLSSTAPRNSTSKRWTYMIIPTSHTSLSGSVKTGSGCCGYGNAQTGKTTVGYDCAVIPQASSSKGASKKALGNGICGGRLGLTAASTTAATVCCKFWRLKWILMFQLSKVRGFLNPMGPFFKLNLEFIIAWNVRIRLLEMKWTICIVM